MSTSHLRAALATVASASAFPYGFTVSLWSAGAILMHAHGLPSVVEVLLFAAGALAGFSLVGGLARRAMRRAEPLPPGPGHVLAGLLHAPAVGAAAGVALAIGELRGLAAWPLAALATTAVYLLGASLELAAVAARDERAARARPLERGRGGGGGSPP